MEVEKEPYSLLPWWITVLHVSIEFSAFEWTMEKVHKHREYAEAHLLGLVWRWSVVLSVVLICRHVASQFATG